MVIRHGSSSARDGGILAESAAHAIRQRFRCGCIDAAFASLFNGFQKRDAAASAT
jgi:hypothetical protein